MADLETELNQPSEAEKRINDLSGKVKATAEEKEAEKARADAAEARAAEAERTAQFYSGFSDIVATNPLAKDHKDEILEKVKGGYTVEDATFAVLGKAGKLGASPEAPASPAGGSAATTLPQDGGTKTIQEMTQEERRQAILDMEARGDIGVS